MKLEEGEDELKNLTQYSVRCSEVDKFLLTFVILKLRLVRGKCILFVNDVERCYRLKLFLEQFSIKSCVLNSELPLNSRSVGFWYLEVCLNTRRYHTVQEFNKGVYDYIIASDESAATSEHDTDDEVEEVEQEECAFFPLIYLLNSQHPHSDLNATRSRRVVNIDFAKTKTVFTSPSIIPETRTTQGRRKRVWSNKRYRFHRRVLRPELRPPCLITRIYSPRWANCSSRSIGDGTFLCRTL